MWTTNSLLCETMLHITKILNELSELMILLRFYVNKIITQIKKLIRDECFGYAIVVYIHHQNLDMLCGLCCFWIEGIFAENSLIRMLFNKAGLCKLKIKTLSEFIASKAWLYDSIFT